VGWQRELWLFRAGAFTAAPKADGHLPVRPLIFMKPKQPHGRRRKRVSVGTRQGERTDELREHGPEVPPVAPSDFLAVDAITRAAEQSGWPTRQAFVAAMYLRIHGVSVAGAAQMFADCQRRVQ
jgi:hypothetical protein